MGDNHSSQSEDDTNDFGRFIGLSKAMQEIYRLISQVAPTNTPVFITGESGTGKEVCAQALHFYSDHRDGPFIPVNCAALPTNLIDSALFGHVKGAFTGADQNREGAITRAENGTLFLDEICDLPIALQAKLLRFTQEHTYQTLGSDKIRKSNTRLICATNKNPLKQISDGHFREDLYYRLGVLPLTMPPLRERKNDIIDIADFYLAKYAKEQKKDLKNFSNNTRNIFLQYDWPGNVRELQNIIQQIVTTQNGSIVVASMLPKHLQNAAFKEEKSEPAKPDIILPLWQVEKRAIESVIYVCKGNIPHAAAILGIAPSTIYRKIQSWNKK